MWLLLPILFVLPLFYSTWAVAEPIVIYDSGQTQPLEHPRVTNQQLLTPPVKPLNVNYKRVPVVTPSLSPGRVKTRISDQSYLSFPIFIVGYDQLSMTWLREHQVKLKQHLALGLAVNVETEHQLSQLQEAAGGIKIAPVPGTKVAKELSLKHYPVLISRRLIEQ